MLFHDPNTSVTGNNSNQIPFDHNKHIAPQPSFQYPEEDYSEYYSNEGNYCESAQIFSSSQLFSDQTGLLSINQFLSETGGFDDDQDNKQEYETMQTTTQFTSLSSGSQLPTSSEQLDGVQHNYKHQTSEERALNFSNKLRGLQKKKQQVDYISTSTLHNIRTIRQYKQHLKNYKKELLQRLIQCKFAPLLIKQVPDREIFFLIGDIIVEPNFRQEWYSVGESSPYNYYKSLVCNILYTDRKILQSDYSSSDKGLVDFNNIVQILKDYPDQDTHDYGLILEGYEQRCKELMQVGNIMKSQPDFDIFRGIQDAKYMEFTKKCEKYIDRQRAIKGEFFFYAFCKLDFDKFSYDIQSFGVSEAMSQLLGLELSSLSTLIQKKGLICSFSNCTRQMMMKNFILALSKKQNQGQNSEDTTDVSDDTIMNLTVHTYDGLSINVEGHFHSVYERTEDFSLIPFTEIMSMVHVKVDENVLEAVKKMRYNHTTEADIMANQGEDLYYNLQSQVFYDKFYASNPASNEYDLGGGEQNEYELEEIKKKTCNYRSIN